VTDWTRIGPPLDTRPLYPIERRALLDVLGSLEPSDWARPTVCPGWDVKDVAGHVLHCYLRRLSGTRDRHRTLTIGDGEDLPGALARANEVFVVGARSLSPRVVQELLALAGPQLDAMWRERDLEATADLDVWWAAPGVPAPVWLDVARDYTEFWVHQQQVRDAVGRPGGAEPELLHPVVDTFARALPHTLRACAPPVGTAVELRVSGPAGGAWTVTCLASGWTLGEEPCRPPAADVELDADTFWRLATRGITPEKAARSAQVGGDRQLGAAILSILSIIR
jgi:uncharacterized protein (TIGR03083 family)